MRRSWRLLPLLFLPLVGCIEPTPAEYIDVAEIPEVAIAASAEELRARLHSTAPALQRRALNDVMAALTPADDVTGYGPRQEEPITGATALGFALAELTAGQPVTLPELEVAVGPLNNVAWFRARYDVAPPERDPFQLRMTGVFLRVDGGGWRLVQAHLSQPVSSDSLGLPSPPSEAPADTAGGA